MITRINGKCWCGCKNPKEHHACKKYYIWDPAACNCEKGKYKDVLLTIQWPSVMKSYRNQKQFQQILIRPYFTHLFFSYFTIRDNFYSISCYLIKYKAK